jgi:CubicO group peptidase (beta-lactamase class C family)
VLNLSPFVGQDGKVIGKHVHGYTDLEKRIPMTADTILPICSISKQFVCLVLAKILREPGAAAKADTVMREMLPPSLRNNKDLTIERLSQMQSGIR